MRKNQSGFGAIELLLILVIVGIVGFAGWYVWNAQNKASDNLSKSPQAASASTAKAKSGELRSGMLKSEKISYTYPADWKLTDNSYVSPADGCVTPGMDDITLVNAAKHTITLRAGLSCRGDGDIKVLSSVPVKSLGATMYIDLLSYIDSSASGNSAPTKVTSACLMPSNSPTNIGDFKSKNIYLMDSNNKEHAENQFCFNLSDSGNQNALSVDQMKALPDFKIAQQLFESMAY
jgi:hypothetical protein